MEIEFCDHDSWITGRGYFIQIMDAHVFPARTEIFWKNTSKIVVLGINLDWFELEFLLTTILIENILRFNLQLKKLGFKMIQMSSRYLVQKFTK